MAVVPHSFGIHPVRACAERISGDLSAIADVPVELMSADDKTGALIALSATADQLEALRLRLLAASDDVAANAGARDAGAWLAHEIRADRREQQRDLRLGTALAERWHRLQAALAAASVNLAQAGVISSDDLRISAGALRRLACTAGIIPVVLGGTSEVLDLGRTSRLFTRAQRKALRCRDRRCRARGCPVPATWCEAHHLKAWALGGATDLQDGVLLCSFHHHRAHHPEYQTSRCPDGDLEFRRGPAQ